MPRKLAGFVLACISVAPCVAQTTTELLQKGIFAQETEGNLDTAILIYRQIVNSAPAQRDLAAQAQFRLGQALLQKGDLTTAAQEFDKLARDYADYRNLVSSISGQNAKRRAMAIEASNASDEELSRTVVFLGAPFMARLGKMTFDESKPIRVVGKTVLVAFLNPLSSIMVEDGTSRYLFATAAAADMKKQQGFSRLSLKPGDMVEVTGVLAAGGQTLEGATAARADLITMDGKTLFDRSNWKVTTVPPEDQVRADLQKRELSALSLAITQLTAHLSEMRTHYKDSNPDVTATMQRLAELQDRVKALKAEMEASGKF